MFKVIVMNYYDNKIIETFNSNKKLEYSFGDIYSSRKDEKLYVVMSSEYNIAINEIYVFVTKKNHTGSHK